MSVPRSWHVRGRVMPLDRPLVMGIVNVTPDSFSDGGEFLAPADALTRVRAMVADGADLIDVGGESTRPHGARAVTIGEELARVLPVVRAIAAGDPRVVISVDTVKSEVAEAALDAGAHVVNDVSALRLDPRMARVIARTGAGAILMHSRGGVADMGTYLHADYDGDVLDAVERELASQLGFAKRPEDSLRVLACLARVARLGYPVVVGASRKRLIGSLTGVPQPAARVHGSVGAALAAYERGAAILRVHDVRATRQALDVAAAVRRAEHASPCAPVA
jgi:dihydropteroate synthase